MAQDVVYQGRSRRLTVRTGHCDDAGQHVELVPGGCREGLEEQPDIVVERDAGGQCCGDNRIGCGIKMRDAGRHDQPRNPFKSLRFSEIAKSKTLGLGPVSRVGIVVPAERLGPALTQCPRGRKARPAKAQNRHFLPLQAPYRDHAHPLF